MFRIQIASVFDRDYLVAEIWYDSEMWAEISIETQILMIQFYNFQTTKYWELPFIDSLNILKQAAKQLLFMMDAEVKKGEKFSLEKNMSTLQNYLFFFIEEDKEKIHVFFKEELCFEIVKNNHLLFNFYSHPQDNYWQFSFGDFIKILEDIKYRISILS